MNRGKLIQRILAFALTLVLLSANLTPTRVLAAEDFLRQLSFENNVVGNVTYSDCVGKPTIVVFGRVTCGNTIATLPLVDQLITQNSLQNDVCLLFIDVDQPVTDIRAFVQEKGFQNVSAYSGNNSVMWNILRSKNAASVSVTFPVVAYFAGNGEIVKVTTNVVPLSDIIEGVFSSIGSQYDIMSLPIMAAYPNNMEKHDNSRTDRAAQIFYRDYCVDQIAGSVNSKANEITANAETDYDKIFSIHKWVADNIYYDFDDYYKRTTGNKYDSATVLATKRSVCEGYANLTVDLLRSAGIPAKKVTGYALGLGANASISEGTQNHAWVEAFADGKWIILDPTWDSTNRWSNGAASSSGGLREGNVYFNPQLTDFSMTHRIDSYTPSETNISTPSSWAVSEVDLANSFNLVPDTLNKAYQREITRAEFCSLAVALYETVNDKITDRTTFADTEDINVEKMASIGVVSGIGNGKFDPDGKLTREQAAVILSRLAAAIGKPLPTKVATFSDNTNIATWAVDGVGQIQAAGIMSGTGNNMFSPKQAYTREQSILTILRLYNEVK